MSKKIFADNYMIYGCDDCKQGFKIYLDNNLKINQKPVPFTISCPFCNGRTYDVSGAVKLDKVHRINIKKEPYFKFDPNQDCGEPVNLNLAKVQFKKNIE